MPQLFVAQLCLVSITVSKEHQPLDFQQTCGVPDSKDVSSVSSESGIGVMVHDLSGQRLPDGCLERVWDRKVSVPRWEARLGDSLGGEVKKGCVRADVDVGS